MANTLYPNFVLENKLEDQLTTKLDMNNYITADYTLAENAGMVKKIHTYYGEGSVQDLAMGQGNTVDVETGYSETSYTVGTTQGRFPYYDEEVMTDPVAIDKGIQHLGELMTNDLTTKAVAEFAKASLIKYGCTWTFEDVVDAIALFPDENEEGAFLLINKAEQATFRKNLKNQLSYVEGFVRTGYIGHIAGVPVIMSAAVPAGEAYLATKEAVTCFVKKGAEIEQDRDANTRKNTVYARKVMVVALTNARKVVKLTSAAEPVVEDPAEDETPTEPDTPVED